MRPHNLLTLAIIGFGGVAAASPILGTTQSFATSTFCKKYQCRLESKQVQGGGATLWVYSLKSPYSEPQTFKDSTNSVVTIPALPRPVIRIQRQNNRVISARWLEPAQDDVFYPSGDWNTEMAASLVDVLTGKRPSPSTLIALNHACGFNTNGKRVTLAWPSTNSSFSVSCATYLGNFKNAYTFDFRVSTR